MAIGSTLSCLNNTRCVQLICAQALRKCHRRSGNLKDFSAEWSICRGILAVPVAEIFGEWRMHRQSEDSLVPRQTKGSADGSGF